MLRYKLRTLLIVLALGPPVLAALFFGLADTLWVGHFTLNVRFVNETGNAIDRIQAAAVSDRAEADAYASLSTGLEPPGWRGIDLDPNGIGQMDVSSCGRDTWLGYELSYSRQRAIVVRVDFNDGTRTLFAADIPPQRDVRDMVVHIPRPK